jgi:hypothetical protein
MSETRPEYGKDEIRRKIAELKGWTIDGVIGNEAVGTSPSGMKFTPVPDWPSNIQDAWELVEEMKQGGTGVFVDWCTRDMLSPFGWFCGVPKKYSKEWITGRDADTAPLAICLAYLAWKESRP